MGFNNLRGGFRLNRSTVKKSILYAVLLTLIFSLFSNTVFAAPSVPHDTETKTYIIKYKDEEKGKKALKSIQKKQKISSELKHLKKHVFAKLTKDEIQQLQYDPNIEYIEQDAVVKKASDTVTANVYQIHAAQVQDLGVTGNGVNIAILDSGIDLDHNELNVAGGVSYVPNDPSIDDPNGHGTFIAGIIGALKDEQGLVGIAPNANLFAVKVLDQSGIGTYSQVIDGIEWAIEHHIDVVCMSFVGQNDSQALQDILQTAYDNGIILVAAAGNDGQNNAIAYPAKYSTVIAVGAVDAQNQRASFSNKGQELALMAPGVDVQGLTLTTSYTALSGTSVSTAHVAGVAALLKSSNHDLNNQQIRQALQDGATSAGTHEEYGYGLLDAAAALIQASGMTGIPGGNGGGNDPGGGDPGTEPGGGSAEPDFVSYTAEEVVEIFGVTGEWLQQELDKGYSIRDISTALMKQQIEGISYEAAIAADPVAINDSDTAESSIDSEMSVEGSEIIANQSDIVVAADVAAIAPDETAIQNVKLSVDQAPYSIHNNNEQISTLSGSLSTSVTDLSLPGRNGLSFGLTRSYDSNASQFYDMDAEVTTTPVVEQQQTGYKLTFLEDWRQINQRYKVKVDMARFVAEKSNCTVNPSYNPIMVNDPPQSPYREQLYSIFTQALNRAVEWSQWYAIKDFHANYANWTSCGPPNYYSWRYFDANNPLTSRIILDDAINEATNVHQNVSASSLYVNPSNLYEAYQQANDARTFINNNKGQVYSDTGWQGSNETGYSKIQHSISNSPNPVVQPYIEQVAGIQTNVKNITIPTFEESRFPLGQGWRWNIAAIESKDAKQYLHLDNGGTYEISGNTLVGYPWQDLFFGPDYSVSVNGETSAYVLKNIVSGQKQYFNGEGQLIEIADAYNNTIAFHYSQVAGYGKQLTSIVDAIGNSITIAYTSSTVVLSKVTGNGTQTVTYTKSKSGGKEILSSVSDPLNRRTTYSYSIKNAKFNFVSGSSVEANNSYALLTGIKYPTGAQSVYTYETAPVKRMLGDSGYQYQYRVQAARTEVTLSSGTKENYNNRSFAYSGDMKAVYGYNTSFSTIVSDARSKTTYDYKRVFISNAIPETYYKVAESQQSITTPVYKHMTDYAYDEARRLPVPNTVTTKMTKTENNQTVASVPVIGQRSYNDYGQLLTTTDPLGVQSTFAYDPGTHWLQSVTKPISNNQVQYSGFSYNASGSLTQTIVRETNQTGKLMSQVDIAYDSYGNPITVSIKDDNRINVTTSEYSPTYGSAFVTRHSSTVMDADGQTSTVSQIAAYDKSTGLMTRYEDGLGHQIQYTYDQLNRVKQAAYDDGSIAALTYNDTTNEVTMTDESGVKTKTVFNPIGWKVESGVFENNVYKYKEKIVYDSFGNVKTSQNAKGNMTSYTYDAWGRVLTAAAPLSNKTMVVYDDINHTVTTKDAESNEIKQSFDQLGRMTKNEELRPNGSSVSFTYDYAGNKRTSTDVYNRTTSYQYDVLNRLVSVTDPELRTTQYAYSLANQLIEVQDPEGKKSVKKYDELGRLIQSINPLGETETYFYNPVGQLSKTIDGKGQSQTYGYNSRNFLTAVTGAESVAYSYDQSGRRKSMTDVTGTTLYDYNSMGQLSKVTYPDSKFLQYVYDANGNRTRMTGPFGQITNYTYDSADRLTIVKDPTNNEAAYKYKLNGLLAEIKQGNGNTSNYTYDGLLTTKVEQKNSLGNVLNTFTAGYDRTGNMTARSDNSVSFSYTYDALNRIQTNSQHAEQYAYDSRGNRQTLQTEQTPNFELNQYSYDSLNRLTGVVKQDGRSVSYKYNGDGLLYERKENNETIRYYYDGSQIIAEGIVNPNGSVSLKARYIRGIGLVARADAAGTKAYYLSNLHGDIVELRSAATGSSNVRLDQYSYDIWGNPLSTQETVAQPFRYSGEMWDSTTNLQYLRARWYNPGTGRFITEDTYEGQIDNPLTLNKYTYVYNNPVFCFLLGKLKNMGISNKSA